MAQFTALNGKELKAVILDAIDKALEETGEFPEGLTFPWVKFEFKVGVVSYPKQEMTAEPGIVATGEVTLPEDAPKPDEVTVDKAVTIEVTGSQVIETPDEARIAANLPIPTPAPAAGVLVDKLVSKPPFKAK